MIKFLTTDIKDIFKHIPLYSVLLGFTLAAFVAIVMLTSSALYLLGINGHISQFDFLTSMVSAVLIGFSFDPLQRYLKTQLDSRLFKQESEQQNLIKELTIKLNKLVSLHEILELIMQTTVQLFRLNHAASIIFQPGTSGKPAIKTIKYIGYSSPKKLFLDERDQVANYFQNHSEILQTEQFRSQLIKETKRLHLNSDQSQGDGMLLRNHFQKKRVLEKLDSLKADLVLPLIVQDNLIGLIILGNKEGQDRLSQNEIKLLETVRSLAINAVDKSFIYTIDQQKNQFVSISSHELLTPLTAVEGYLSMILEEGQGKVDKQVKDYLVRVFNSSRRLSVLIEDLLSVSRIESGDLKIEPQALDLESLIQEAIDQTQSIADGKGLEIELINSAHGPLPKVWSDPDRAMQVLVNIISNALKYTPKGKVSIETNFDRQKLMVQVDIRDSGIGMSKDQQQHLFQKFYRVASKDTENIMGTGLGLYITKAIIEKIGGHIHVESQLGKGSCFSILFPVFQAEAISVNI